MAYNPEDVTRIKHLLDFGQRFLNITDSHDDRLTALENATRGIVVGDRAYWNAHATYIPPAGTLCIYTDYATLDGADVPGFKVGDGNAYVVDLAFSQDDLRAAFQAHISNSRIHLSEQDRNKLESSVTVSVTNNNLIFQ